MENNDQKPSNFGIYRPKENNAVQSTTGQAYVILIAAVSVRIKINH